jgi:hypothetical protein
MTPVARAPGGVFGAVVVSPVRTVLIVTVERPFALAAIASRGSSVDGRKYLRCAAFTDVRRGAVTKVTRAPSVSPS